MLANIARSFPELSNVAHARIAQESMDNLARGTAVFLRLPQLFRKGSPVWIDADGLSLVEEGFQRGKGILVFTAHYGCWELMSAWIMKRWPRIAAVYRALDNPRIDAYVKTLRCSSGGTMIERKDILRKTPRWLKANGLIGFLVDQNFAPGGAFVEFFGRIAATTPALAILARRTGATFLHAHTRWEGSRLRLLWGKAPPFSENPNIEKAILEDTQAMTKVVEGWIREDPGQWLWLHNRWKRQPQPGETIFGKPSSNMP